MSVWMLCLLGLGLSMDAFAVSVTNGMCYDHPKKTALLSALFFGFFQGFMPLLGFFAGLTFRDAIAFLDHWIALVLLSFIGGQMIWNALKENHDDQPTISREKDLTVKAVLLQAIATSIDALTVGVSFAVMDIHIWQAVAIIGGITFCCALLGAFLGKSFGLFFKNKAEIFGGIILIAIGVKIFLEHTLGL